METEKVIEGRIEELKWKSLPPFERLIQKKESVQNTKFNRKARLKELNWYMLSANVLIVLMAVGMAISLAFQVIGLEIVWFFIFVLAVLLAQRLELSYRLSNLKEVKFLKKLLKDIK
ncbi:MAG: hypothetical protein ACJAS3_000901 [Roseivirga sp.]|jgi:hypothetical protein